MLEILLVLCNLVGLSKGLSKDLLKDLLKDRRKINLFLNENEGFSFNSILFSDEKFLVSLWVRQRRAWGAFVVWGVLAFSRTGNFFLPFFYSCRCMTNNFSRSLTFYYLSIFSEWKKTNQHQDGSFSRRWHQSNDSKTLLVPSTAKK